jgi:hypothetical protein
LTLFCELRDSDQAFTLKLSDQKEIPSATDIPLSAKNEGKKRKILPPRSRKGTKSQLFLKYLASSGLDANKND